VKREGKNRWNQKRKKEEIRGAYTCSTREHAYSQMRARKRGLSHVCARTSPHTSALKHETRASTRVPLSYTHARMQTHAPFGKDKTGRMERGNRRMGVGARHECEEGRTARVSSPSSLSSYMSSLLLMAMSTYQ
jgi:hypothetical protein